MAINYKQLPDYNQFVQSYFVDQELLDAQDVGTVLVENATVQTSAGADGSGNGGSDNDDDSSAAYGN